MLFSNHNGSLPRRQSCKLADKVQRQCMHSSVAGMLTAKDACEYHCMCGYTHTHTHTNTHPARARVTFSIRPTVTRLVASAMRFHWTTCG